MEISTQTIQTRRVETLNNIQAKKDLLQNLNKSIKNVKTTSQRTMQFGDNWAKRESSTVYDIDNYLTRSEEYALRMENMLRETLAVYSALHVFDGVMSAETYNSILDDFKKTFENILNTFNNKGYVLTLYIDGKLVGTKLFDDVVRMKLWFNKHLGVDYKTFLNPITVPPKYKNSVLIEQDWCTNPDEFFNKLKNQS